MQRLLITGSNGLLGQSLLDECLGIEGIEVLALSRGANRYPMQKGYAYVDIDLTDFDKLNKVVRKYVPDYIINTAAMTNVDICEDHKESCYLLNVELVQQLVSISESIKAHLIHISTDFIFDGRTGTYKETDAANPLSYYGETKMLSEQLIQVSNINFTIFRTILVYGKVHDMSRNNIVLWVRDMLMKQKELTIVNDQYRMPTYVKTLAKVCVEVLEKQQTGIFNVSSTKLLSIYDIAQQIAETFNLNQDLIKPISSKALVQRAKRPLVTGFDLTKTQAAFYVKLKTFKEDLQCFKEKLT